MNTKHQIAAGATLTLGTLFLFYVYQKFTSKKPDKSTSQRTSSSSRSAARTLLSKYNPRPTDQDIQADNEFQGRVVISNQVSEGGIIYHDIRYPKSEPKDGDDGNAPETASSSNRSASEKPDTVEEQASISSTSEPAPPNDSRTNEPVIEIPVPQSVEVVETEQLPPSCIPVVPVVAASVVSKEEEAPPDKQSCNTSLSYQNKVGEINGNSTPHTESECSSEPTSSPHPSTSNVTISDTVVSNGVTGGLVTTEEFVRNVVRFVPKS